MCWGSDNNYVYLGTIDHYNKNLNLIKLKDIAEGYQIKENCGEINIGFSRNFLEKIKVKNFECYENKIVIFLSENFIYENDYFINKAVFVPEKYIINVKPDYYLVKDLIDCKVIDNETGRFIGKISDVSILPGNDVWFVDTDAGEIPLPVIKDVIQKVDIEAKCVYVRLLDGLIDLTITNKDEENQRKY